MPTTHSESPFLFSRCSAQWSTSSRWMKRAGSSLNICVRCLFENRSLVRIELLPAEQFALICIGGASEAVAQWFTCYLQGRPHPLPSCIQPRTTTPFTQSVYAALSSIPFGSTVSYEELARLAGHPKAVRAVATLCRRNPLPLLIPCHRVIRKDGSLGGYSQGLMLKKQLLAFEKTNEPLTSPPHLPNGAREHRLLAPFP